MTWIIRHDDDQNGVTYATSWKVDKFGDVDAEWSARQQDALRFHHRDIATLVATRAGGDVRALVRPKMRRALEFVAGCGGCSACARVAKDALAAQFTSQEKP